MTPLDYVRLNFRVFPCTARKRPLIKDWGRDASTDPRVIEGWWRRWPRALIGVPTGRASGIVILDVDIKNPKANGFDSLVDLGHAILPETPLAHTQSGGLHAYFDPGEREIRNSASRLGPGLDIRGEGGLVIVPGERGGYQWDPHYNLTSVALAPCPGWISPPEPGRHPAGPRPERSPGLSAYGEGALDSAVKRIIAAPRGEQHSTLLRESFSIGTLAGIGLPAEFARKVLKWAGARMPSHDPQRPWRESDINRTVDDGLDAGMRHSRRAPA